MQDDRTDITIVLDRSGSMQGIARDMEGGLAQFLEDQMAVPGNCQVTLWQFDDVVERLWSHPLAECPPVVLAPRGRTALNDAWGRAMVDTGSRLAAIPEAERPAHVIFIVVTDGMENASKEWTREQVRAKVEEQESVYKWTFVFLAANMDAVSVGGTYGLDVANTTNYAANSDSVATLSAGLSASVGNLRGGGSWNRVPDAV